MALAMPRSCEVPAWLAADTCGQRQTQQAEIVMLAGIAILLAAYVSVMQTQPQLPSDFRLHFEFGDCWSDVVDTDKDHYVRVLYSGKESTRTVPLRLSDAHRRQLLKWIDESRFFELPAYVSATGEDGVAMIPSPRYELSGLLEFCRRHPGFQPLQ